MCGFCGVFDLGGHRPIGPARVAAMNDGLAHRGPDGGDLAFRAGLGFGHRRLAIIDLPGGAQPMANEDGQVLIVFNGEIYNFQSLRRELDGAGHRFATSSDTEVLVHGYEEWGLKGLLARLNGMFAFALFDARTDRLVLARDRLGEKPLHYAVAPDGCLLFASEIDAVVAGLERRPPLDPAAVADYFAYGYVPDPRTIYKGIAKLPPGHHLTAARGRALPEPTRYWRPNVAPRHRAPLADLAAELAGRFEQAVEARMIADVPLGAFLSGGVDSSGVVAAMAERRGAPVTTCTIGFGDPAFDETAYARKVAERYRTDHREERVGLEAAPLIDRLARVYGEPFADSSALPTYVVSGVARRSVTVALSGDGGDEVFAGYRRYPFHVREERLKARLPAALRAALFGPLARLYPKLDRAPRYLRAKATFEALAADTARGYLRAVTALPDAARLFAPAFGGATGGYDPVAVIARHLEDAGTDDPLARAQHVDLMTWLPGRMLVKVDRASMAHGLEVRPPLLDHELVEWAAGLPEAAKLDGFAGKRVLKEALAPKVPADLLRRPKQGFSLPLAAWLRGELRPRLDRLVADGPLLDTGWFDRARLRQRVDEHVAGARDHHQSLWALMMFDAFLRHEPTTAAPRRETAAV